MDISINQKMKRPRFRFGGSVTTLLCNTVACTDCFIHTVYFPKIDYMSVRNMLILYLRHSTAKISGMTFYYWAPVIL